MDSRIAGLAKNNIGSIVSQRGIIIEHDTATGTYGIIEVSGASATTPVFVEVFVNIATAFDATTPVLKVESYDGSSATDIVASGDVAEGTIGTTVRYAVLTDNDKVRVNWNLGTDGTAGLAYVFVRVAGKGTGTYLDTLAE